jgi:nucleotide-binding universal stress UspA family protein
MKSILVHLDASPRAAVRLALAQALASRHGAELDVLYGVVPSMLASPWAVGDSMAGAASLLADLDRQQIEQARERCEQTANTAGGARPRWLDGGSSPYYRLLQRALYADLVVLGQADASDEQTGALPPDLVPGCINDSGRPALIVPCVGQFTAVPSQVLIAWKPAREAARAVTAALPCLRLATKVHVASRPEGGKGDDADFDHLAALVHALQLQGVTAAVQTHHLGPGDVGEALLSLAADTGAELLVMGCYGHSRAREWVLGGASRSVLRSMTLPVLMAH